MECFIGFKSKEAYEKYYEKLGDWHLNIIEECDINKIKKLLISCRNIIILTNESDYKFLLNAMKSGDIKRADLELFLFKLEYYFNKIKNLKIELGCHIVTLNEGYKDIKTLRTDFANIYKYIIHKKKVKRLYVFIHKKYKYILQGSTSDFMTIKTIKQAKYIKLYIELLWLIEAVNKLWQLNINTLKLAKVSFDSENILINLENTTAQLQRILDLYLIYNKSILKLLKKNTCFKALNPYEEATYDKIDNVINYMYYFDEYIIQKNFKEA